MRSPFPAYLRCLCTFSVAMLTLGILTFVEAVFYSAPGSFELRFMRYVAAFDAGVLAWCLLRHEAWLKADKSLLGRFRRLRARGADGSSGGRGRL